jgi:hypothetical protein
MNAAFAARLTPLVHCFFGVLRQHQIPMRHLDGEVGCFELDLNKEDFC